MSLLVIIAAVLIMLIIKGFLLTMAYDKRKNAYIDPEELAEKSIAEYKKKNQIEQLLRFRDIDQIRKLFEYHLSRLLHVQSF